MPRKKQPEAIACIQIPAWACTSCRTLYHEESEADACCRCQNCGRQYQRDGYGHTCPRCSYGSTLRETRKEVRRRERDLECVQERLARLLREGRPT